VAAPLPKPVGTPLMDCGCGPGRCRVAGVERQRAPGSLGGFRGLADARPRPPNPLPKSVGTPFPDPFGPIIGSSRGPRQTNPSDPMTDDRRDALEIWRAAVDAVDPRRL